LIDWRALTFNGKISDAATKGRTEILHALRPRAVRPRDTEQQKRIFDVVVVAFLFCSQKGQSDISRWSEKAGWICGLDGHSGQDQEEEDEEEEEVPEHLVVGFLSDCCFYDVIPQLSRVRQSESPTLLPKVHTKWIV
jgi:hypothetical protein